MKKIKLLTLAFAALFAGSLSAVETTTGKYSVRTIDKSESKWSFADLGNTSDINVSSGVDNGLYFKNSKGGNQKVSKSKYLSNKAESAIGFEVPSANAEGTISMTVESSSDGRYFQLYVNDTIVGSVSQRLWSKAGDDLTKKGPQSYAFTKDDISTIDGKYYLVFKDNNTEMKPATFTIVLSNGSYEDIAADDATLKSITVGGEALEGFSAETETYNVELPYGTVDVPFVAAVTTSAKATAVVHHAASLPGATTIVVTAEDGTTTKTYTINFTVAQTQSDDATIGVLAVDSKDVPGYRVDSFNYSYELPYNYEGLPVVTAHANDETATVVITQATEIPGTATIVVTAQAGNTLTYTIAFTKAAAPKILAEVLFSNGAKGASLNGVVRIPYLEGTDVPSIVSATAAAGGTAVVAEDGATITVTGSDNTTLDYTIEYVALAPVSLGTEVVTFDSTETYIFDPYGWDASKGWKFAKSVEDAGNRRISEGRTRIYMALPAAKEVLLTSGAGGARAIKVLVNGVENADITSTAKSGETITIPLDTKNNNFVAIESNQTKGDGGFTAIQLVPAGESAIDNTTVTETVQKMMIDGQLVIIKNGVRYNAQGMQL